MLHFLLIHFNRFLKLRSVEGTEQIWNISDYILFLRRDAFCSILRNPSKRDWYTLSSVFVHSLKENCQPCCWIIWSRIKSKVVLCWLSIEHTIGNKCRLFQSPMFFQVVCLRKYIHRAHISILCVTTNKIILARFFWPLKKVFADFGGSRNFQFSHDKLQKTIRYII